MAPERLAMACLGLAGLAACRAPGAGPTAPPNLVIVLTDDQGWADAGCYGATDLQTPHLDRLAAEGMRFTDFLAAQPVCTPTRAGLLTGIHPMRLGLGRRVLFPFSNHGLHPDEETLAEFLGDAGYATACVGKWHLGHHPEFMPLAQGFDTFFGVPYSNDMDRHHYVQRDFLAPPLPLVRDGEVVEEGPDQRFLTRRFTDAALEFLGENAGRRPFFLYLAHCMPHQPIHASPAFAGRSEAGTYGDVIAELDASVGEVLAALEDHGVAEDTLVLFLSDNGPWREGSAGPWRGRKGTTWEGGLRVPFLARWPAVVPPGTTCDRLATCLDVFPTLAEILRRSGSAAPDGRSLLHLLRDPDAPSAYRAYPYYRDERLQALRHGRFKLHLHRPEWRGEARPPLLFDLEADPGETRDVAAEHPRVVARMLLLAEGYRSDLGDAALGRRGANVRAAGQHVPR